MAQVLYFPVVKCCITVKRCILLNQTVLLLLILACSFLIIISWCLFVKRKKKNATVLIFCESTNIHTNSIIAMLMHLFKTYLDICAFAEISKYFWKKYCVHWYSPIILRYFFLRPCRPLLVGRMNFSWLSSQLAMNSPFHAVNSSRSSLGATCLRWCFYEKQGVTYSHLTSPLGVTARCPQPPFVCPHPERWDRSSNPLSRMTSVFLLTFPLYLHSTDFFFLHPESVLTRMETDRC